MRLLISVTRQQMNLQLLELNPHLRYRSFMFKRFSHFFVCLLLVLMPLQGFAAANMSICNSMMQAQVNTQQAAKMPCHMASMVKDTQNSKSTCKSNCKTSCATLCSSLAAMTAIPSNIKPAALLAATPALSLHDQTYASITQPNLQRPPIFLS